jgi:predicted nuclease with TOPRIM domain
MRKLLCSLGIALLATWGTVTLAEQPSATDPSAAGYVQAPLPPAPAQPTALPAETAPAAPALPAQTGSEHQAVAPAGTKAAVGALEDPTVLRLKAQIKTVRLSLAETSGRLSVIEKDLLAATADNTRLRTENTTLHTDLSRSETVGKKAEEEVAARRQEVSSLTDRLASLKTSAGGTSTALVFALTVALILAAVVFGQGSKIRRMLARLPDGKGEEKRLERLRSQLEEEQQKAVRLDEECQRLREASNRTTTTLGVAGPGSKKDKIEQARRELREAKAAAEAQKRADADKLTALQADLRANDEKLTALEAEVARLTEANHKLERLLAKANEKLTFLGHEEGAPDDVSITPSPV